MIGIAHIAEIPLQPDERFFSHGITRMGSEKRCARMETTGLWRSRRDSQNTQKLVFAALSGQAIIRIRPVNCIFLCQPEASGRESARRGRLALVCHFGGDALAFGDAFGENAFALYYR